MSFKKANKSSIIRIIISKFNDKEIQEIKVLYHKQGGVDTFKIGTKVEDGKVIFTKFEERKREYEDNFVIEPRNKESTEIKVTKEVHEKVTREYTVSGKVNEKNPKEITIMVEDINKVNEKLDKRRKKSETKRLLLNRNLMERYSQIAQCDVDEIDSQKIYKIKRFLSYRSNMLIYFQFINDFLKKESGVKEIWKLVNKDNKKIDDEIIEKISKNILNNYISKEIEYHNNRAKKINEKNKDKKFKEKIESINLVEPNEFKEDVEKMLYLFADLRHKLMHYEYKYFENIFEGKEVKLFFNEKDTNLNEMLDLNLFKELSKITQLKEENKNNYLNDESIVRVLGKEKKAKKIYKLYNMICNRKNGFNKFINSLFSTDGVEDSEFKKLIKAEFEERVEWLESVIKEKKIGDKTLKKETLTKMREELNNKKNIVKLVGEPYIWDIHQSKPYKEVYNLRKEKVAQLSTLIAVGKNKENKVAITKLNKELLQLKNKMEEITKLNSIMRLEIKMQVAFGFLISNFGENYPKKNKEKKLEKYRKIDLDLFLDKNRFESFDFDKIDLYRKDKEIYLKSNKNSFEGIDKIDFNFGQLESRVEPLESFLSNKKENNLSKFYILMYLLLPVEMRGDLLGFVKKHYYDIKNIDFVEIKDEDITKDKDNTEENQDNMEKNQDKFFHNLRMFEKNSKKFEIINYGIIDFNQLRSDFDKIYEKFGLNVEKLNFLEQKVEGESKIFDKNIILPIMKYYQHIFKLLNDIEIHALFKYGEDNNLNLKKSITVVENQDKNNYFNFSNLMNLAGFGQKGYKLRNKIVHLNYEELFLKYIFEESNVNEELEKMLDKIKLEKIDLGLTYLNDFYQRKEQFIYNQKQINVVEVTDSKREEKFNKEKQLLEIYNLKSSNLDNILKKYLELIVIDENTPIINNKKMKFLSEVEVILPKTNNDKKKQRKKIKEMEWFEEEEEYKSNILGKLNRDSSDLLGIYKKYMIKSIKGKLINLFIKGERRYLNLELYNKTKYNKIKNDKGEEIAKEMSLNFQFNNGKNDIITLIFKENSPLDWSHKDFIPTFEYGTMSKSLKQGLKEITGKDIKNMFDKEKQIFTYESPFDRKKICRNILNGSLSNKENYMGIYIQKIKGLY